MSNEVELQEPGSNLPAQELDQFPPPLGKTSSTTSSSAATATGTTTTKEEEEEREETDMPSDKQELISDDDISSEDSDEDNRTWHRRRKSKKYPTPKWWFQDRRVKRNWGIVAGVWLMILLGIGCLVTGISLEIINHTTSFDVVRGFIFLIIAVLILIPSVYAAIHMYLAAKRVGRVKISSVWFFLSS